MLLSTDLIQLTLTLKMTSDRSRPSDKGRGAVGGHPDPEIRVGGGGGLQFFFLVEKFGAGPGPTGSSPGSTTDDYRLLKRQSLSTKTFLFRTTFNRMIILNLSMK